MRGLSVNRHILDALSEELFKRTKMSGLVRAINFSEILMDPYFMNVTTLDFQQNWDSFV